MPLPSQDLLTTIRVTRALVQQAVQEARAYQLQLSQQRLLRARTQAQGLPYSSQKLAVLRGLDAALQSLTNPYNSTLAKVQAVESGGFSAIRALDELQSVHGGLLSEAIRLVQQLSHDVRMGPLSQALQKIALARNHLIRFQYDSDILRALNDLNHLEQRLRDPYLSHSHKIAVTQQLEASIIRSIQISRAYASGHGPIDGGWLGQAVLLGETRPFDKIIADTEVLHVGLEKGAFRQLQLRALRNSLAIDTLTIEFTNGAQQTLHDIRLSEQQTLPVNLEYGARQVSRLIVTAVTDNVLDSRASLQVSGIR